MSYEKNARVINDDIFDLVNSCFEKERSSGNIKRIGSISAGSYDFKHIQIMQ